VLQPPADFHGQIADPGFSEAIGIVPATAAVDAAVDRFEADAAPGNAPMRGVLGPRQRPAPRLVRPHDRLDLVERERQEAAILEQPTARGQGGRGGLGHPFVMGAPRSGITPQENHERRVDQLHVWHRVTCFLAAITARLRNRSLGTLDVPCRRAQTGGSGLQCQRRRGRRDGGRRALRRRDQGRCVDLGLPETLGQHRGGLGYHHSRFTLLYRNFSLTSPEV
jgi:hypothetical protein